MNCCFFKIPYSDFVENLPTKKYVQKNASFKVFVLGIKVLKYYYIDKNTTQC